MTELLHQLTRIADALETIAKSVRLPPVPQLPADAPKQVGENKLRRRFLGKPELTGQ